MELQQLNQLIYNELDNIKRIISDLSKIEPFSTELSLSQELLLRGLGPITSGVANHLEYKKMDNFMKKEIYNGMTFERIGFDVVERANKLIDWQKQIQDQCNKTDKDYYGNIVPIFGTINKYLAKWYLLCPHIAQAKLDTKDGKFSFASTSLGALSDVTNSNKSTFAEFFGGEIHSIFEKLDLPKSVEEIIDEIVKSENATKSNSGSGCLVIALIVMLSSIITACSFI